MSLKETLKNEAREEQAKLKKMSFRDKLWYIWEYYKIHMLIGCVISVSYTHLRAHET